MGVDTVVLSSGVVGAGPGRRRGRALPLVGMLLTVLLAADCTTSTTPPQAPTSTPVPTASSTPTPSTGPATPTATASPAPALPTPVPSPSSPSPAPPVPPPQPPAPPTVAPPAPPSGVPAAWRGVDVSRVATDRAVVALTFDAGSSNAGVASVLATLARYDVPATFFVTGQFARRYPADVRAISAAGHPVGNHSDSHPDFTQTTTAEIQRQLSAAEASISAATGHAAKPLFRFPYGARTAEDIHVVNDAGYVPFRWTVDTLGWKGTSGGQSMESVRARVLGSAQPGEIVLMHVGANPDDGSTLDAAALGSVIEGLRERGYSFITLRSLLP
ncbi:polysaccharide deacetylase family protein [Cellulomonas sp. NTE-D12]|uniref:polysaccharide deacetylase family protein n=1 Tax=Cellulomonas sp. NTE-D12 TaxID=2962632 RepID=UPI003081AAC9|nr:hypothetical protein CELD12_14840 [Cellulomonas sp. NTE-D12]